MKNSETGEPAEMRAAKPGSVGVFIINLARASDRREHMEALLRPYNVPFEFFEAVDGRALSDADLALYDRARRLARYGVDLEPNEIACYLSHVRCWEHALRAGYDRFIVLEDDVEPAYDFAELVRVCAELPEEVQFVRLFGLRNRKKVPVAAVRADLSLALFQHGASGTQGYFMTRSGVEQLRPHALPLVMQVDVLLDRYWQHKVKPFVFDPFVIRDADQASNIGVRTSDTQKKMRLLSLKLKVLKWRDTLVRRLQNVANRRDVERLKARWPVR